MILSAFNKKKNFYFITYLAYIKTFFQMIETAVGCLSTNFFYGFNSLVSSLLILLNDTTDLKL